MEVDDGTGGEQAAVIVSPTPAAPTDKRARRELLDRADTLVSDLPSTLRRHRKRLSLDALWELADATRVVRALQRTARSESPDWQGLTDAVVALDGLIARHLPGVRPSGAADLLGSLSIAIAIALFIRTFLFEAFQIPTGSMIPTLLVGDRIFVSKFVYGVPIPFSKNRLFAWRQPTRGEVVVFDFPREGTHAGKHFIKRVIAIAGDTVRLEENTVHIDGQAFGDAIELSRDAQCVGEPGEACSSRRGRDASRAMAQGGVAPGCPCTLRQEGTGGEGWVTQHVTPGTVCECQRTFAEGEGGFSCSRERRHVIESPRTLRNEPDWPAGRPNSYLLGGWGKDGHDAVSQGATGHAELTVPPGFVFVMGDNRDFSEDGRYWGLVPVDRIEGKAWVIWYSSDDPWGRLLHTVHKDRG